MVAKSQRKRSQMSPAGNSKRPIRPSSAQFVMMMNNMRTRMEYAAQLARLDTVWKTMTAIANALPT